MSPEISHLTSLFENATEGIILTDGSGKIALVNPAVERLFGYQGEELVGQAIEVLIPDRYKSHHHKLREGFYQQPSNRVMGHGRDLNGRKKDGTDIPLEVSLSHYRRRGELFVIAFIVDISARKAAENNMLRQQKELEKISKEVRQLNTELEAKVEERTLILKEALQKLEQSQMELSEALDKERELNEIKSRFVSMASHEFRTPLSTVLSSASLLSRYTLTDEQEKRNKHIRKIKDSVKHLNNILEDFLSLGKLNEGRVATSFEPFDLRETIEDTIEETKSILKKGQTINCFYEGAAKANSDRKLLMNILINLIGNAIKFSDEGMPIEVRTHSNEDSVTVAVVDRGIGISKEDQEHLFSSFFRGKNVLNIQGTGLGLHIVKRYLDILGGSVKLESELDKGTTITIILPNQLK